MARHLKRSRDEDKAAANDAKARAAVEAVLAHAKQAKIPVRPYGGRDA